MKRQKLNQARNKETTELKNEVQQAKRQLVRLRLEVASGKIKNKRAGFNQRKEIAQLETIIKEKEQTGRV